MKKYTLIILLIIIGNFSFAQNLVPNPSFEEHNSCCGYENVAAADGWYSILATPDYFNVCDTNDCNPIGGGTVSKACHVPNNYNFGYQCPATGNAYAGIYTYINGSGNLHARDYFGSKLNKPLIIGKKYFVSFKLNLSNVMSNCANSGIGVLFQTKKTKYLDTGLFKNLILPNKAQVFSKNIITDTIGWNIIKGSFIADSNYQYIMIGNLFDENNILIKCIDNYEWAAYYFIDDICVSEDSLTCENIKQQIIDFKADSTQIIKYNCFNLKVQTTVSYTDYKWDIIYHEKTIFTSNQKEPRICLDTTGNYTVKLIATNNNGCGDTITKYNYINVGNIGIIKNNFDKIKIKQNNNIISFENLNELSNIFIYNNIGQKIYEKHKTNENINISNFNNGIYFININNNNFNKTFKFIKF